MKILHIGWGFQPWRGGGLIEYAEDLMEIQKLKGYNVYYFFAGRHYPFLTKSKLLESNKNGIKTYEIINSPLTPDDKGTLFPNLDLHEPTTEKYFRYALKKSNPDLIHIHELAGLPSSLIEIAKNEFSKPIVMNLADYFLLCPTLKLFNYLSENCLEKKPGNICVNCCAGAPKDNSFLVHNTIVYELKKLHAYRPLKAIYSLFNKRPSPLRDILLSDFSDREEKERRAKEFNKRRAVNLERLKKIDLLIARSMKVQMIYRYFLGDNAEITTLQPTLKHLEFIKPKQIKSIDYPIKFVTLNGCASVSKGAILISQALTLLYKRKMDKLFQLHIFGVMPEELKYDILKYENVYYHGIYNANRLNDILEGMHVGIVSSIWEEVFGYVGLELLAKGIPLIGNNKGGITEYTIDGETGYVNKTSTAEEMSEIMEIIIKNPTTIMDLNNNIISKRNKLIKSIEKHFHEVENLYRQHFLMKSD